MTRPASTTILYGLAIALPMLLATAAPLRAQTMVSLEAVMILASDKPAPIDRRLENIEYQLRKIFRFKHYLHYGQASLALALPGSGRIDLGRGYRLEISASSADKGKIRVSAKWLEGKKMLLSTTTVVPRGRLPTILGGASHGDGKLIVTLRVE